MILKYSKNILMAVLLTATAMTVSCKSGESGDEGDKKNDAKESVEGKPMENALATADFKKTDKGLYYSFEKENPDGQQVKEGDVLVGEMVVKFDTVTLFDTKGVSQRIVQANPNWEIKVGEGLMMMHVGEVATFAMDADTVAKFVGPKQMHPAYRPGIGQKVYYKISLQEIVSREDLEKEQAQFAENVKKMQKEEPQKIREYVKKNNIKVKPTADGLYVIVKKKGDGEKVTNGKQVTVHYTGCLLDGTKFDSSVDRGEPFSFVIGQGQVIQGWDKGLLGQTVGSKLQLVIPSSMAYGDRGAGGQILPYSPLTFEVEIISVK